MGMNHAGEIAALTTQVRPHVALVTAIAPAHIENLGSEENIARAKAEIFEGLEPGGIAIVPADSPHAELLAGAAQAVGASVTTFGLESAADIKLLCDQQRLLEAKFPPMSTSQLLAGLSLGTGAQAQAGMGAMGT